MAKRFENSGTLLRGPDGSLYFIANDALAAYKLEHETAESVNRARVFDRYVFGAAVTPKEVGLSTIEDKASVAIVDLSALRQQPPPTKR